MSQSKTESFIEVFVNTLAGFCITFTIGPFIYDFVKIQVTMYQNFEATAYFTILSILRGYVLRRFFNNLAVVKLFLTKLLKRK